MNADLFSRRGLSIDRLRSFLNVADAGAIARAAPGNPVRQSQWSRQIGELEEFLGTALVTRKGRGIALTPAGARLAIVVRELIAGLADVVSEPHAVAPDVSLGAGDSVLQAWVIPRLGAALARAPKVTLTLATLAGEEVVARLLDARLDLGILRATELRAGLRSRPLGTVDYALYVPRRLAPRKGTPVLELFGALPMATQYGEPELSERLATSLRRAGVEVTPALVCETFPQVQRAVATGLFAAMLPTFARAELRAQGCVELRDPLLDRLSVPLRLAWTTRLERQRPRIASLVPLLASALARA